MAMRNALRECFPESVLHACWFHFTQASKRYASKLSGFVARMRANPTARSIYCRALCLPLLPANKIEGAYHLLVAEAAEFDERFFRKFFAYFKSQWLEKVNYILFFKFSFSSIHKCIVH